MFRIFDLFGKSAALKALDAALRDAGLHPATVPEPVKLTLLKLAQPAIAAQGHDAALADIAQFFAFAMLGPATHAEQNGPDATANAETRLDAAIKDGDSLDARIILLALHAGLISPEIADRIEAD